VTVSASETLEAIAVETGYTTSAAATAAYTIGAVLPAPTFTPPAGTYTTSQSVMISDATAGTTIYYTTNGATPTTSSSVYSSPVTVSSSETLEAIAVKTGYTTSAAATAAYTITTVSAGCTPASGYSVCETLTIASGQIPGSLTNFPIPLYFNMTMGNGSVSPTLPALKLSSSGGSVQNTVTFNGQTCPADVTFTSDSGGTMPLSWDCALYTGSTGALAAYVKESVASGGTNLYMSIGNASQSSYTGGAVGAAYDGNYVLAWHFGNGTTLSYGDSTSNGDAGNPRGTVSAVSGQLGGGISFPAGSNYVGNSDTINIGTSTFETWVYYPGSTGSGYSLATFANGYGSGVADKTLSLQNLSAHPQYYVYSGLPNTAAASTAVSSGTWYQLIGTNDGTNVNIYINGVLAGHATGGNSYTGFSVPDIYVNSSNSATTTYYSELRVSSVARSANWITAQYNAESAPSTFFSLGSGH